MQDPNPNGYTNYQDFLESLGRALERSRLNVTPAFKGMVHKVMKKHSKALKMLALPKEHRGPLE
jgi:ribosomal protein L30/L7E